jgi:hypothetical protein
MLRKLLLVTVAVASLSAVTLAPTPASAWHGGWRGGGWGWGDDGVPVGADGAQVGASDGDLAGDLVGDLVGDGVAQVGVGVDRPTSWPWILWRPGPVGTTLGVGQSLLVVGDDYCRDICNPFRSTDGLTP